MNPNKLKEILNQVSEKKLLPDEALELLKSLPFKSLSSLKLDTHRTLRTGQPEVIYSQGKTTEELAQLVEQLNSDGQDALLTRLEVKQAEFLTRRFKNFKYDRRAKAGVGYASESLQPMLSGSGTVAIISAGASDLPVAREAELTAQIMGAATDLITDVGVAGIHRLNDALPRLANADCVIVVAGMEGALVSVVAGLIDKPVIGVPTSVGYGASFGGLAALLGMLNSCASGVAIVNIDNGFGAGAMAAKIGRGAKQTNPTAESVGNENEEPTQEEPTQEIVEPA